jgi:hypothetical protein
VKHKKETEKNKNPNRKGTLDGRVFAFSEDSFALPLTSKLDALFGENVSRFPRVARKVGLKQDRHRKNKNPNRKGWDFCLRRVDKKDATLKMEKFLIYQGIPPLFEMFFKVF